MKIIRISNDVEMKIISINKTRKCGIVSPFKLEDGSMAVGADILADAEGNGFWYDYIDILRGMKIEDIDDSDILIKNEGGQNG